MLSLWAQDVTITVTPVQRILPPQAMLYVSNPGKYFNVSLTNNTQVTQNVYMGMQLSQVFPESGLSISTPATRQPRQPIVIAPGSTRQLTLVEIKQLFNHIPSNEISTTPGLFDDYANGSFGLLPEGDYTAHLTAYKWDPTLATPVVVSNPISGTCNFTICYKAQAPQFITPTLMGSELLAVATVSESNTQFTWTESTIMCNPRAQLFRYDFVVKEMMPGQQPDVAMDRNPVVYQSLDLLVPMCVIPPTVINKLDKTKVYVAQVTAKAVGKNPLDYVLLENNGKSTYRMFRFGDRSTTLSTGGVPYSLTSGTPIPSGGLGNNAIGNTGSIPYSNINPIGGGGISTRSLNPNVGSGSKNTDDQQSDEDEEDEEGDDVWQLGGAGYSIPDSLYVFNNPRITSPDFIEGTARKLFLEDNITVTWRKPWLAGGIGTREDTLSFKYDVQIYKADLDVDRKSLFETEPLLSQEVTEGQRHVFTWNELKDKVEKNDYLILHVKPTCTNEESVAFINDTLNVIDFVMVQRLSKQYFQCSDMVEITNTTPTTKLAQDLKGRVVGLGQYQLTIDDISKVSGKNAFKGKGHVEWNPMGYTVMVAVKFNELYINTDDIVYQGEAESYPDESKKATDAEVVDKILSDTGIDQIVTDTGIPFANLITSGGVGALHDIAKTYDISKYYEWVRTGKNWYDDFLKGNISDLHLPLKLPKSINKTPVDVQIVNMKFSPTHATMNIIGELVLPKSNYTRNEILVLGAPRICMSPDRVLPEGGSISLLSDFTVVDPSTKFEMTFNAPQNVVNPTDGCYISWKADELELILLDFDMQIPKLKKVDANGDATNERPILNIKESIASWDELVAHVTMDNFEVDGLNGWLFKPGEIVFDYSMYRNGGDLDIPKGYSWKGFEYTETEFKQNPGLWKGIYINDMEILFPKTLQFGNAKNTEDGRLKIAAEKVIYDFSGLTLSLKLASLLDAKTTKLGGWTFSIDNLQLNILQSKFKDCFFDGKFDVPLLDGTIGYKCDLTSQGLDSEGQTKGYDFTFTTKQIDGLKLDFFLGQADFKKNWTFFELSGGTGKDTHVELCAGGYVTIKGTKADDSNLVFNLLMPKIKFAKMRVGNFPLKDSKLAKNIKTDQGWTLLDINKAAGFKEEYTFTSSGSNSSTIYFGPGSWSLSSLQKNIGPFGFTLKKYGLKQESNKLGLNLAGAINVMDNMISAETDLTIWGKVNLNNFSASYSETQFNRAAFGVSWAGVDLSGSLVAKKEQKGNSTISGYTGTLHFKMPGNIVEIDGEGGYYSYSSTSTEVKNENDQNFKYGYFIAKVGGKGLHIPPVVINEVKGGFYFNCTAKKDQNGAPTPRKGLIGGVFGLGLAVEGGDNLLNGKFDMTVVYDTKYKCLSTFLMNGTLNALSTGGNDGIISAKATIAYQCLKDNSGPGGSVRTKDQYFSLDLSCDVKITPEDVAKAVTTTIDQYVPLMNELEGNISAVTGEVKDSASQWVSQATAGLNDALGADSKKNTFQGEKAPTNSENGSGVNQKDKEIKASAGGHIALNFKVTKYENYTAYNKVKWHIYLGEPGDGTEASEEEKRCGFKMIDLKSPVVTVKIGANAYLCVGNEMPNNGALPPIPQDILAFLNGGSAGMGVEQADAAKAQHSRDAAMQKFLEKASVSGGVMLGAKAYGYIDVDLGLLYAYLGAVAGFDVSIVHIDDDCNGKPMGVNGWYGTGQIYAMLEARMGIRIRLGFYNNDFDILHAQLGALLKAGMPNPFWMVGQARVKLKLLGGLIKLNRSFKFECGSVCLPYLGSPLDNFELFTNCSVGGESKAEGWEEGEPINISDQITFETSTELGTRLNLYDENFAQELAFNNGGENDDYRESSNRTYVFNLAKVYTTRKPGKNPGKKPIFNYDNRKMPIELVEFTSPTAKDSTIYNVETLGLYSDATMHHVAPTTRLKPNRYYKLYLYGNAKEIINGVEQDPFSKDTINAWYGNLPWSTMKCYYFRTKDEKLDVSPTSGIQNYVALAYPSSDGHEVVDTLAGGINHHAPNIFYAYQEDIARPNIAFSEEIRSFFDNNKLKWSLYDETTGKYVAEDISNEMLGTSGENLNWVPSRPLYSGSLDMSHNYVIKLEYLEAPKTMSSVLEDYMNEHKYELIQQIMNSTSYQLGTTEIKERNTQNSQIMQNATYTPNSSVTYKGAKKRKATTKFLPPVMQTQTPLKKRTVATNTSNQPSTEPTTNIKQASAEFASAVSSIVSRENNTVVRNDSVRRSSGSTTTNSRPTSSNVSNVNRVTKTDATMVVSKAKKRAAEYVASHFSTEETGIKLAGYNDDSHKIASSWDLQVSGEVQARHTIEEQEQRIKEQTAGLDHRNPGKGGGNHGGGQTATWNQPSSSTSSSEPYYIPASSQPWDWPAATNAKNESRTLLYGIRVRPHEVTNPVTDATHQREVLNYSKPFIAVQLGNTKGETVAYAYNRYVSNVSDYQLAFDKPEAMVSIEGETAKKSIRLIDPYYYANYLGGYLTVSGWESKKYDYDSYPMLSTEGLVFMYRYGRVIPTLARNPKGSGTLAKDAYHKVNYQTAGEALNATRDMMDSESFMKTWNSTPIPSRTYFFGQYDYIKDAGASWALPVYTSGSGIIVSRSMTGSLVGDILKPYNELRDFTRALHNAAVFFETFFAKDKNWKKAYNDIYRGCYINASSQFDLSSSGWKSEGWKSYERDKVWQECDSLLRQYIYPKYIGSKPYFDMDVYQFLINMFNQQVKAEKSDDMNTFCEYMGKLRDYGDGGLSTKNRKNLRTIIDTYNYSYDSGLIFTRLLDLPRVEKEFTDDVKKVRDKVSTIISADWNALWKLSLHNKAMTNSEHMFNMPYYQIPFIYYGKDYNLSNAINGMSKSHPRANTTEGKTLWERIRGSNSDGSNYEVFDSNNYSYYFKGVHFILYRVDKFNLSTGSYTIEKKQSDRSKHPTNLREGNTR